MSRHLDDEEYYHIIYKNTNTNSWILWSKTQLGYGHENALENALRKNMGARPGAQILVIHSSGWPVEFTLKEPKPKPVKYDIVKVAS